MAENTTQTQVDNDWKTTLSAQSQSNTTDYQVKGKGIDKAEHILDQPAKEGHRPTDPLDEYFYEQAKFFRHLERKFERFNKNSKEDEQRARQGKFKHVSRKKDKGKQDTQVQAKPISSTSTKDIEQAPVIGSSSVVNKPKK
jgi:hypothetical protein